MDFRKLLSLAREKVLKQRPIRLWRTRMSQADFDAYQEQRHATWLEEDMSEFASDLEIDGDYVFPTKSPASRLHVLEATKLFEFIWGIREAKADYNATAENPNPWFIDGVDRFGTTYFGCLLVRFQEWDRIKLQMYERVLEWKAL